MSVRPLPPLPDEEALLAGMVLSPLVYARNQRFELYQRMPRAKVLRARAARLRGAAKQWIEHAGAELVEGREGEAVNLSLHLPHMAFRQTLKLSAFERALVAYLIDRARRERPLEVAGRAAMQLSPQEREAIDAALLRLA